MVIFAIGTHQIQFTCTQFNYTFVIHNYSLIESPPAKVIAIAYFQNIASRTIEQEEERGKPIHGTFYNF